MGLRTLLAELRHRGVLKVATGYLATGWVVTEGVSILFQNFEAPNWVLKVFSTLVILGFPVACLLAWGFEFTPQGVRLASGLAQEAPSKPRRTDALLAGLLILVFALVTASLVHDWRASGPEIDAPPEEQAELMPSSTHTTAKTTAAPTASATPGGLPIIIILDTPAPRGVYEQATRDQSGTNADDLNEVLRDMPAVIQKEAIGAIWDREDQIVRQHPDLVLIHRSGFFHAMNQEFGFGYPAEPGFDERRARWLYEMADNRLAALLGYIGQGNSGTRFLVYSRGTGGGWEDDQYRATWVKGVEGRFPLLKGRVNTLLVPGGPAGGSFQDPETMRLFREQVQALLD